MITLAHMPESFDSLSPELAWTPLPRNQWDESAVRHLLQRVGFSATPAELDRTLKEGAVAALNRYFARMPDFPKPRQIEELEIDSPEMVRRMVAGSEPTEKRMLVRDAVERSRQALMDMTLKWLQLAAVTSNSPAEKWLLFLSDIWVVGAQKVRNAALIHRHLQILRERALGSAPALAKAMTRSPAMINYLDLQQSRRDAPNENFARELFELFTLGEGNYTESDIKQAARAFTGYRQRLGEFVFAQRQHDAGSKTVFGRKGNFDGDDIIDLVYKQPASATFLPREMVRFYLSDTPLPDRHLDALGAGWAETGYDLRWLLVRFFSSRAFYAADFRGAFIKSPIHYYLGLMQDLDLSVTPLPRQVAGVVRQMGQMPFDPPNVRGWVGGRAWINSATLTARRQLVRSLLQPLNENALNADEQLELAAAHADGITNFTVDSEKLAAWSRLPADECARRLVGRFAPALVGTGAERRIEAHLASGKGERAGEAAREVLAALLESPDYQLC